jgi:hypothetical protein
VSPQDPQADEFYIGYEAVMPPRMGAQVRRVCVVAGILALAAAGIVLGAHRRLDVARFDYGRPMSVSGTLARTPYPSIDVNGQRMWLVSQGKSGAGTLVASAPDGRVSVRGALVARGRHAMLEVVPGSLAPAPGGAKARAAADDPGREVTLRGEIVDSKCFLGVMNPGERTVHRDCARLCLRGGIPPMLLVRGAQGEEALVLLVSESGAPIGEQLADIAGQPVEVRGLLARDGETLVLRADRARFTSPQ